MAEVFVSYKAEDRPRVCPLVEALEAEGLSVWWDARVGGGEDWRDTIAEQLDSAHCVIVVWSKRSTGRDGRFVRDEATRALRKGVYLPITIDAVEPPLGFGETQVLDLSGWKGRRSDPRYRAVLAGAHSILGREAPRVTALARRAPVSRRAMLAGGGAAIAAAGAGAWLALGPRDAKSDSIAVLPFANLSSDPAQAYFSDGLAEELRSSLSRIAKLTVVARTSSEVVRGDDARTAAQKLDVAHILTGSVRRSATTIRVSAQLVDGIEGVERWSQTYNRAAGDVLEIQTDIADMVAQALSIQLRGDERGRLTEGGTNNAAAQDLLLKARASFRQSFTEASLQRSIGMIDAALALDPNYADAMAENAAMLRWQAELYSKSAAESRGLYVAAAATAKRAIQLAPQAAGGHSALAKVLVGQLNRRAAQVQWDKARSLPGIDGPALGEYAIFLSQTGPGAQVIQFADRAIVLDPLNPVPFVGKAIIFGHARRYAEAVQAVRRAMNLSPAVVFPRALHAYFQMMLGNTARARAEFASLKIDDSWVMGWEAVSAARQGDMTESDRILARLRTLFGDSAYYQVAQVLAQQGKKEEALEALEKALIARDPGLNFLLVDPLLDPLRADGRFQALLRELGFPT